MLLATACGPSADSGGAASGASTSSETGTTGTPDPDTSSSATTGPSSSGSDASESGNDDNSTTANPDAGSGGQCFQGQDDVCDDEGGVPDPPPDFGCTLPSPCPGISLDSCMDYCETGTGTGGEGFSPEDEAAARCMLELLRDRTPAQFGVSESGDLWSDSRTVRILANGVGYRTSSGWSDLCSDTSWAAATIKPPEYFQACLDNEEGKALLNCALDWSDTCVSEDAIACP